MDKDRFGYGTSRPKGGLERIQDIIDSNYHYAKIKAPIPQASIKEGKLHVEVGMPPGEEDDYIEWLKGVETMDAYGWDDTAASFRTAGLSEKQSDIVYTINGKPISKNKGLFGTDFLKMPGTDFIGGIPR